MKIATIVAQVLVGLEFVVFGLNPFLHFLPATLPPGLGGQFLSILFESKYVLFVAAVQVISAAALSVNHSMPRALTPPGAGLVRSLSLRRPSVLLGLHRGGGKEVPAGVPLLIYHM